MEKTCKRCLLKKEASYFKTKNICLDCNKVYQANYRKLNRDKILYQMSQWRLNNADHSRSKKDRWWIENRDVSLARRRKYYHDNKEAISKKNKEKRHINKDVIRPIINKKRKEKRNTDIQYKLQHNLRSRLNISIRNKVKTGSAISDLGCSIQELKIYLESLFQAGMSWDNWGIYGWHIDHIKPISLFDLTNPEQVKEACNYKNLQPLWAIDNIKKSNNYIK